MIRHVVMFRWKPETTPEDVAAIEEGLRKLPAEVPEIQRYSFGADEGLNEGNFDYVVVADFASADDWRAYRDHPAHQTFIEQHSRPNTLERTAVQYEFD
jgi:Stress responsive A/B Barrel Domain